ncbi:glycosyltransferase family 4 protein [Halorussus salilacus]|uniref:glycosyltransferase family 4 protein n=1 Tax=Halorussus salilacus TaxID=2953750 RepID=UPI00209F6F04|nr:glycosyltransferase family 4 protein [Halorussus salilacus]USZ69024.1 glycosyltransferase family 4 protein [Halorussus salilacus]
MRVAFVSETVAQHRETGATERTRRTAEALAGRGHDAVVCCAQWWDGDHETFEQGGVTYRAVTDESPGDARGFALGLAGALRAADPDVIQVSPATPSHVVAAKLASIALRAPLVVDWYDAPEPGDADDPRWRLAAAAPELVLTPSETVRTRVRELGPDADAVRVVPNAIDIDAIRAAQPREVADVVYSRRLDEDANLESLLLALAELRDRDWSALVIGDGPERDVYERQVRDLRIEDRVSFAGHQPLENRLAAFKGAHVYAQTARRESFPTDLLRALACGCAGVVEYHVDSSAHELVEQEDRAFRTTSEQELTDALVAASEMERLDFDENFAEYDDEAVLDRYLTAYDEAEERLSWVEPAAVAGGVLAVVALAVLLVAFL